MLSKSMSFCKSDVTFILSFLVEPGFTHIDFFDGLSAVDWVALPDLAFFDGLVAVDWVAALLDRFRPPEVVVGLIGSTSEGSEAAVANIFSQSMIHYLNISNSLSFQGGMLLINLGNCFRKFLFN